MVGILWILGTLFPRRIRDRYDFTCTRKSPGENGFRKHAGHAATIDDNGWPETGKHIVGCGFSFVKAGRTMHLLSSSAT